MGRIIVYVGMPELGGVLPRAARAAEIPVMVSANRFRQGLPAGRWRAKTPDLKGMRIALDSAGFVAHRLYGRYPWTVAEYVSLVAQVKPEWWVSMDFCCEPSLGEETIDRQIATTALLSRCRVEARRRRVPGPMPVLQGWDPDDYIEHADQVDRAYHGQWPGRIGVGSVCRRPVHGPTGVLAVVDRLDRDLPAGVGLHLFGVKSSALDFLESCSRVASVDSMAWDFRARKSGSGQAHRIATMLRWYRSQTERRARGFQRGLW